MTCEGVRSPPEFTSLGATASVSRFETLVTLVRAASARRSRAPIRLALFVKRREHPAMSSSPKCRLLQNVRPSKNILSSEKIGASARADCFPVKYRILSSSTR
jgi:hypothetical protein